MSKTITVSLHYRIMKSGRDQLVVPAGCYGVDRSSFPDNGVPSVTQSMAVVGAILGGYRLSVWAEADTDAAKEAARQELSRKLRKALMVLDRDDLSFKLS